MGCGGHAEDAPELTAEAEVVLLNHAWNGNVRELENRIQRAVLTSSGPEIRAENLDLEDPASRREADGPSPVLDGDGEVERKRVEQALLEAEGIVSRAAVRLGLSRQALYRKMEKLGIVLERRPRA